MSYTKTQERDRAAVRKMAEAIAPILGVDPDDVLSPSRKAPFAFARQVIYYIGRERWRWECRRIGAAMDREHSTVAHGTERLLRWIAVDRRTAAVVAECVDAGERVPPEAAPGVLQGATRSIVAMTRTRHRKRLSWVPAPMVGAAR